MNEKQRQAQSDRAHKAQMGKRGPNAAERYSNVAAGWIEVGDQRIYVRSSWEANIACYFEFLRNKSQIFKWEYEPEVFIFHQILRGTRSYTPDFRITNNDGSQYYCEVKGWMDPKSKVKISRLAKYYPEVRFELIDAERYKSISRYAKLIPGWGQLEGKVGKK